MRLLLTGAAGMLGSSIADAWAGQRPDDEIVRVSRHDVDLRDRTAVRSFIAEAGPDAIIHAAARVAGIQAKLDAPASYLLDNLLIDSSVLAGAIDAEVPELLYVSSAAIFPADGAQPLAEAAMLTGSLERANEGYGLAKITGTKLCEYASTQFGYRYRAVAPSNLYGPGDSHDGTRSHLIAAAISKVHAAKQASAPAVDVWGDGTARREFTFAPDLAAWLVGQIGSLDSWPDLVNVGAGVDHSIREYYETVAEVVGYNGALTYDQGKPAGVHQRLLDSSRARELGWAPTTPLAEGIARCYEAYLSAEPV